MMGINPRKLTTELAQRLHRPEHERFEAVDPFRVRAKYVLTVVLAFLGLVAMLPVLAEQFADWGRSEPLVLIPKVSWRVVYGPSKTVCGYDTTSDPSCLASPAGSVLWNSSSSRADAGHRQKVASAPSNELWLGTAVPVKLLREAALQRANHVILGWIRATYNIWIDGHLVTSGNPSLLTPLVLQLPMDRLRGNNPLRIAIQLRYEPGVEYPDFLNSGLGEEGFATHAAADHYLTFLSFVKRVRPLIIGIANLLVGALFLLFWRASPTNQEYFYMAVYALVNAFYQFWMCDVIELRSNRTLVLYVAVTLRAYEGILAMFLGLAYARTRKIVFRWGLPTLLLGSAGVAFALRESVHRVAFLDFVVGRLQPALYAIGSLACFLQALYLIQRDKKETSLPTRVRRLFLVGSALGALGLLSYVVANSLTSMTQHNLWFRFVHLALGLFLSAIVFSEHRKREQLIEKSPVSEYHRRAELPEQIYGTMLVADLKYSEPFYRHRARRESREDPVAIWRSHFYTAVTKHGGTVIQRKGDEIIGFFDKDKSDDPTLSAVLASDEMERLSGLLERDFRERGLYPPDARGFHFRAAIAQGAVRPVWENVGGSREAYWEETGGTSPFVESARLLEFERQIAGADAPSSLLIMRDELAVTLAAANPGLAGALLLRSHTVADKHGKRYEVAAYRLGVEHAAAPALPRAPQGKKAA
ncbi:MAG: hypothetical protein HY075_07350 [Deltaproteobacteria bacterium]|nr:hypothetical protein [Deltaproteobacteria bacterium]